MTKEEKINHIWDQIFNLQKMACMGELCLLDKLHFNDLKSQLEQLGALVPQGVTYNLKG